MLFPKNDSNKRVLGVQSFVKRFSGPRMDQHWFKMLIDLLLKQPNCDAAPRLTPFDFASVFKFAFPRNLSFLLHFEPGSIEMVQKMGGTTT
jgi:hypothetical protein